MNHGSINREDGGDRDTAAPAGESSTVDEPAASSAGALEGQAESIAGASMSEGDNALTDTAGATSAPTVPIVTFAELTPPYKVIGPVIAGSFRAEVREMLEAKDLQIPIERFLVQNLCKLERILTATGTISGRQGSAEAIAFLKETIDEVLPRAG